LSSRGAVTRTPGLINTSQQIGGALGIAALSTIATSRTDHALASEVEQVAVVEAEPAFGLAA
jgi:hypothetical protein